MSQPIKDTLDLAIHIWQATTFLTLIPCHFFLGGRKVFRAFLRCEYSEENILFWLACEDLKKERSPEVVEEKARVIYEDYVSILSPREVSQKNFENNDFSKLISSLIGGCP